MNTIDSEEKELVHRAEIIVGHLKKIRRISRRFVYCFYLFIFLSGKES